MGVYLIQLVKMRSDILIAVFRYNCVPSTVHPTMRLTRGSPVFSCRFLIDDADTIVVAKMRHDY